MASKDLLLTHRMIGINYVLRALKQEGIISNDTRRVDDAVQEIIEKIDMSARKARIRLLRMRLMSKRGAKASAS